MVVVVVVRILIPATIVVPGELKLVLVEVEHAQQQKHGHQPGHHKAAGEVEGAGFGAEHDGVGQQMKERHTEHEAGNRAHGELSARVRHAHPVRQRAAGHGGEGNGRAVGQQQGERLSHGGPGAPGCRGG